MNLHIQYSIQSIRRKRAKTEAIISFVVRTKFSKFFEVSKET